MKILHIIPSISPIRGGPSQAVLEMVWALRQQGIDAEIATTNDDGNNLLDVPLKQLIDYPINPQTPDRTVPIRFFPRFSPNLSAVREFAFSYSFTTWLWQRVVNYDCLHIHAIFSYTSPMAMLIAQSHRIPYIVRPLGALCHWSLQQSKGRKQHYLNLIRKPLQNAKAIHFTSSQEQQEATNLGLSTPSFILPHGLNLPQPINNAQEQLRMWLNLPDNQPILLFLSRLHPKKGLEALITSLENLQHHPFQLIIAGSGEATYEQQLQQQLAGANLLDRSHLIGFVAGESKQLLLQGADLFVLPSHSENFGIAVLEAMAAGLPSLITPEVGLAPIVQQHNLGWVVAQEPQAIANAIYSFFSHSAQYRNAMGERASAIVASQFTWEQVAQELIVQYGQSEYKLPAYNQPELSSTSIHSSTTVPNHA